MFKRSGTLNISDLRDAQEAETGSRAPSDDPFLKYKIFKQVSLICVWICLGFYLEITGPSLPDLKDRIGVDLEQISQALIAISIGIFVGSIVGGVLNERFYRRTELIISLSLLTAAVSTTCVPHVGSLPLVAVCFFINGITEGLINTGGNTMVMHMWGEKAPSPMHSLHFGFGVGAIMAPQVVRPFLAPRNQGNRTTQSTFALENDNALTTGFSPTQGTTDKSRIEFAYMIAGIFTFCFSMLWLGIYIRGPPRGFPVRQGTVTLTAKMFSPATWARGDTLFGTLIMITLFFYFIQTTGGQRTYGRFLFTFLVESDLKFTNTEAANLNSLFWGSFTLGRGTGIPIANFVSAPTMIAVQAVSLLIICIIMAATVFRSRVIIWVFSVPLGYFIAQVFPSGMSWTNIYLDMNSVAVMVLLLGAATGGVLYQYLPGYLLKNYGQTTLMYIMVVYAAGLLVCFIVMTLLARSYVKRNPRVDEITLDVTPTADQQDKYPLGEVKDNVTNVQKEKISDAQVTENKTELSGKEKYSYMTANEKY